MSRESLGQRRLIILGVDSDAKTNTPIWPPNDGLMVQPGMQERVFQKATEAVHPPVRVSVSPIIEIPSLPGRGMLVIRVDESKDAPHAVAKGREIYVYERSDSKTDPIKLAHLDRIGHLVERRRKIEDERDGIRRRALERSTRLITDAFKPVIWLSVIPLYPWRDLCAPSRCYDHFLQDPGKSSNEVQRIPDGAIFVERSRMHKGMTEQTFVTPTVLTCDCRGHFLFTRGIVGVTYDAGSVSIYRSAEVEQKEFNRESLEKRFGAMFDDARKFYSMDGIDRPGLLSVQIGLRDMRGCKINDSDRYSRTDPKPFLDDDYVDETTVEIKEFLAGRGCLPTLLERLLYAFDVAPVRVVGGV